MLSILGLFVILAIQAGDAYVLIDPTTGRAVEPDTTFSRRNGENGKQNQPVHPGDFVRGRTGNVKLFASDFNPKG